MTKVKDFKPATKNANKHTARGMGLLEQSIRRDGWIGAMTTAADGEMIAGSARIEKAAEVFGVEAEPIVIESDGTRPVVIVRTDIPDAADERAQRLGLADNRIAALDLAFDVEVIAAMSVDVLGDLWTPAELSDLGQAWANEQEDNKRAAQQDAGAQTDKAEELREKWQTASGQLWQLGEHRLICGDCRESATWERLLQGVKANGVFTSPPYSEQRKEQYGGTPAAEYVAWWEAVQANVKAHLAADGSFFVNIKPHCEDGQRALYVIDLVAAMVRSWGWLFIDENIWHKPGIPGTFGPRLRDRWESIFCFALTVPKFRPDNVAIDSDDTFEYADVTDRGSLKDHQGNGTTVPGWKAQKGKALPGNVLQLQTAREALGHVAAFPVALPDFFIKAYSDTDDVWLDPFCGSGTTIIAAENNGRRGMGIEMLPKYCAVILERYFKTTGKTPVLVDDNART